jgi:hypothetical protein
MFQKAGSRRDRIRSEIRGIARPDGASGAYLDFAQTARMLRTRKIFMTPTAVVSLLTVPARKFSRTKNHLSELGWPKIKKMPSKGQFLGTNTKIYRKHENNCPDEMKTLIPSLEDVNARNLLYGECQVGVDSLVLNSSVPNSLQIW